MQSLQTLIDMLVSKRQIHISLLDLTGVLDSPLTRLRFKNTVHSKEFCDVAKQTERGYRACLDCKMMANLTAVNYKEPFEGHCAWGMYEAALPVVKNDQVIAVVYVGNAIINQAYTLERIDRMCQSTKVNKAQLLSQISGCERLERPDELHEVAEIVADYLLMLSERVSNNRPEMHWMVSVLKGYADELYHTNPTLKEIAVTYHKNDKYIGRLFKKEMGVTFNEYCLAKRLDRAAKLLRQGSNKIIDVALESGFDNISYFNRTFKKRYSLSPTEYLNSLNKNAVE